MQDADRISDLVVCLPRNGLDDSVIQIQAEGTQAAVSFHILSSGRNHEPSILAEELEHLKREHFQFDSLFCACNRDTKGVSFILKK